MDASFIKAEPAADCFAADKPSKYGLATNHSDSKKLYWVFPKIVVPQTKGLPTKLDHVWWFLGTTILGNTHTEW